MAERLFANLSVTGRGWPLSITTAATVSRGFRSATPACVEAEAREARGLPLGRGSSRHVCSRRRGNGGRQSSDI